MDFEPCVLKDVNGLIVTVKKFPRGLKLCAVERQVSIKNVSVCRRVRNNKKQMAFCFTRKDETKLSPKVDGKNLKVEKIDSPNLTESHWFEMVNVQGGKHFNLQSVAEPSQYLSLERTREKVFCLSKSGDRARVTDEIPA